MLFSLMVAVSLTVVRVFRLCKLVRAAGIYTKATVKFNREKDEDQTWKKAKAWFRKVATDHSEIEKYSGVSGDLLANAAVIKQNAAQEARDEITSGMEHSFGQLAQAAVAKAETIDANAATISALTKALAEMTAACKLLTTTNGTLVTALAKCGGKTATNPPPGFSQAGADTSHALNSAGVACPTKKNRSGKKMIFVEGQTYGNCKKDNMFHLPANCPTLPENVAKQALSDARWLVKQADKKQAEGKA